MQAIQILGQVVGAVEGALSIVGANGVATDHLAGPDLVVTHIAGQAAADQFQAVVGHLAGQSGLKEALAAHLPHLPSRHLGAALALIDGLTAAYENDGKLDAGELMGMVTAAIREEM